MAPKTVEKLDRVVVRFAGDSGDGMQLTGSRFTDATALVGNDLATLPDFPAEIRAPAGTPHGVSAFQIHFASRDILTPGDHPNVLVAMNPAALNTNLGTVEKGGTVIVNEDGFTEHNLRKAGYESNPLEDGSLDDYQVFRVPMTSMTVRATEGIDGITRARRGPLQEPLRARPRLLDVRAADRADRGLDREEVRRQARRGRREPRRLPGRLQLRRDGRAARRSLRGRARRRHRPAPTATSTARRRSPRADRRERPVGPRPLLRELPDHAGLRAAARALAPPPASACARSRPRTRSPPRTWRSAPPSGATSGSPPRAAPAWT